MRKVEDLELQRCAGVIVDLQHVEEGEAVVRVLQLRYRQLYRPAVSRERARSMDGGLRIHWHSATAAALCPRSDSERPVAIELDLVFPIRPCPQLGYRKALHRLDESGRLACCRPLVRSCHLLRKHQLRIVALRQTVIDTTSAVSRALEFRVDTSSWTDATLVKSDLFYPPSVRIAEVRLRFYAERFNTLEVDVIYYALLAERNAQLWVERTPVIFCSTSRHMR